jgi:hypothetical protein
MTTNKDYLKQYRKLNKDILNRKQIYKNRTQPWLRRLKTIKQRCTNPNSISYPWYGGKGIKCLITAEELRILWFRDGAYRMKKPSIDRKDSNGNYKFSNCRFIEFKENVSEMNKRTKCFPVQQYNLKGVFLKDWDSISAASQYIQRSKTSIKNNLIGKTKTCGGFIWRYKNEK